jgi:hypothetical protein
MKGTEMCLFLFVMISLDEFRKILGETAINMTDEEVESVRKIQYKFAEAIFDKWLDDRENKVQNKSEYLL